MMIPARTHKKPVIVTIILIHVDNSLRLFTCFKDQYQAQQGNESPKESKMFDSSPEITCKVDHCDPYAHDHGDHGKGSTKIGCP